MKNLIQSHVSLNLATCWCSWISSFILVFASGIIWPVCFYSPSFIFRLSPVIPFYCMLFYNIIACDTSQRVGSIWPMTTACLSIRKSYCHWHLYNHHSTFDSDSNLFFEPFKFRKTKKWKYDDYLCATVYLINHHETWLLLCENNTL